MIALVTRPSSAHERSARWQKSISENLRMVTASRPVVGRISCLAGLGARFTLKEYRDYSAT